MQYTMFPFKVLSASCYSLLIIWCLLNAPSPTKSSVVNDAMKALVGGLIQELFGGPMIESTIFNETISSKVTGKSYTRLMEHGKFPENETDFAYDYEEHFSSKMENARNISIQDIKQCILYGLGVFGISLFQLSSVIGESMKKYSNVFFNMPNELSVIPLPSIRNNLRDLLYPDNSNIWAQIDYKNLFLILDHVTVSSLESSVTDMKHKSLLSITAKCRLDKIDLCGEYVYTSYNLSSSLGSFSGSICHRFWNVTYSSRYDKFMKYMHFKTNKLKEEISFDFEDYPYTDVSSSCDTYDKFDPSCWTLLKYFHREGLWRAMSTNYTHLLSEHLRAIIETDRDYPRLYAHFVETHRQKVIGISLKFIALYLKKADDVVAISTDDGIEIAFENLSKFSDVWPTSKLIFVKLTTKGEEMRLENFDAFPRGYTASFPTFGPALATSRQVDCDVQVTVGYNGLDKATVTYGRNDRRYDMAEVKLKFTARLYTNFSINIVNVEFEFDNKIIPVEVKRNIRSTVETKLTNFLQSTFNETCPK